MPHSSASPMPPARPYSGPMLRAVTLALLGLLLTACASAPKTLPPVAVPRAPTQPEPPAWCLPTCSFGWKRMVESLQSTPTPPESPASSATN